MCRAPKAEISIRWRISVEAKRRDTGNPCAGEAMRHIGFEIELVMANALPVRKEAFIGGIGTGEARQKLGIDFIGGTGNAGADSRRDPIPLCPKFFHRVDGCIGNAAQRTFPTGVGGTNNAGLAVSE